MSSFLQLEQDSYELHCEDLHPTNKFVGPDSPYMKPAEPSPRQKQTTSPLPASPRTRAADTGAAAPAREEAVNVIGLPSQLDLGERQREMKEQRNKEYNDFLVRDDVTAQLSTC